MTFPEIRNKMLAAQFQKDKDQGAIVAFARGILHTLRDAGSQNAAKELERLLWELDAHEQEHSKWMTDNIHELMPALIAAIRAEGEK